MFWKSRFEKVVLKKTFKKDKGNWTQFCIDFQSYIFENSNHLIKVNKGNCSTNKLIWKKMQEIHICQILFDFGHEGLTFETD